MCVVGMYSVCPYMLRRKFAWYLIVYDGNAIQHSLSVQVISEKAFCLITLSFES